MPMILPRTERIIRIVHREDKVTRLRYMIEQLEKRKWYAEVKGIRNIRNNSGYDYFRNIARLYRSYRIKYGIYEVF